MADMQGDMYGGPLKGDLSEEDPNVYDAQQIRRWALDTNPDAVVAAGQAYDNFRRAFQGSGDGDILGFLQKFGRDLDEAWGGPKSGAPQCQKQLAMLWQSAKALLEATEILGISLKGHGENHLRPFKAYFETGEHHISSPFQQDALKKTDLQPDNDFKPLPDPNGSINGSATGNYD
jgi:hypothetical protein